MPLFVWISGYLLVYTQQSKGQRFKHFAKKRFLKLLIPYFALSIIAILPKYTIQQYLNDTLTLDSHSILRAFFAPRQNIWGHFWFLPMIFIQGVWGYVLDKLFSKLCIRKIGWTAVSFTAFLVYYFYYKQDLCQWFSVNDLIAFSWVFASGCLCGCFGLITKLSKHKSLLLTVLAFIISIVLFAWKAPYTFSPIKDGMIAIIMILSLIELCIILAQRINVNKNAIYAQTFIIFLLSWPCQAVVNIVVERLLQWPYYLIMPIQFCSGIIGPMIFIYFIIKIERKYDFHWISFILGNKT